MKAKEIKRRLKFNDYKNCLLNNEIILKLQQRFKSETHNVYTEEINKITLSNNDDNKLKTLDRTTKYPYGYKRSKSMQNKFVKVWKMINIDDCTNKFKTKNNLNWACIPAHP